jgi:hypothetical protein
MRSADVEPLTIFRLEGVLARGSKKGLTKGHQPNQTSLPWRPSGIPSARQLDAPIERQLAAIVPISAESDTVEGCLSVKDGMLAQGVTRLIRKLVRIEAGTRAAI